MKEFKMKVLYLSLPGFVDSDFPLVKSMQEMGIDITYVIDVIPSSCKSTLFEIEQLPTKIDLHPASEFKELKIFNGYLNFEKVHLLTRLKNRRIGWCGLKAVIKLIKFIEKEKFDVIHTTYPLWYLDCLLYKYKKRMVLTVHDPFPHTGEVTRRKCLFRAIAFKLFARFVILNKLQLSEFSKKYHIDESRITTSALGIYDYLPLFSESIVSNETQQVLFYGRISPYKGIDYLCKAMEIVHEKCPKANLVIAGSGSLYFDWNLYKDKTYMRLINRYLSLTEIVRLISESRIIVCPYTDATQSGVVTNAFSMSKPVIATRVGGLPDMVENEETGLIVEPRNENELAWAIIRLLTSEEDYRKMCANIDTCFHRGNSSWRNISEGYVEMYSNLVEAGKFASNKI